MFASKPHMAIAFDRVTDSGAQYKVQLTPFMEAGIYITVPIHLDDVEYAKREALSVARHICNLLNAAMPDD